MSGKCTVYGDLAHKYKNVTDDKNPISLFTEVLGSRDQQDKQKNNPVGGELPTLLPIWV